MDVNLYTCYILPVYKHFYFKSKGVAMSFFYQLNYDESLNCLCSIVLYTYTDIYHGDNQTRNLEGRDIADE